MDKYQIGTNAGIVWNVLKDNAHWDYEQLKTATGLTDRDLNAAIGWLAREDKIDFDINNQHDRLFLNVNVYIG
ncbi:winged helix-turn-helix domain-containing protein [Bacteroides caecigallinarum]|uniref:winged helix-turn-helix domain-containing protein n=1 Tax=Bacteroides caecigallinarum TaxID=1411144 RepID=UPI001959F6E7|nr:winged helix-turn-helix domain-containing protein [Bacteroides caecigallinarum]MBM6864407.1 winged helix-turn-helix domain-containing protein [Bacteroides caecigallinarum]MBU3809825.1 winged helix-turn-helix domain-containing protein [Candidatus Phocaeicola faecipullorum]